MKIFPETFLFKEPIKWAKETVGSKYKFWLSVSIQISCGAFVVYESLKRTADGYGWIFVLIFMIIMPINYLYALRKLLLELQKREKT